MQTTTPSNTGVVASATTAPAFQRLPAPFCLLLSLLTLTSCSNSTPTVSIITSESRQKFIAKFTEAFDSKNAAGDYEVVLLDDPIDRAEDKDPGQPLLPTPAPPVRQVLHIRLLWKPVPGTKPDSPAATNASLHWYVLGTTTVDGTPFIHYAGSAFVTIIPDTTGAEVTLRNGLLKRVELHGNIADPLQSFRIDAKFHTTTSETCLTEIMTDVKSAMTNAKTAPVQPEPANMIPLSPPPF